MRISDWSADVCASDLVKLVGADTVRDQGLGNAVVLDHGNGWRSYYGHMRRGSIAVKKGDRVQTGQALGLVGMSGLTEFPHLAFSSEERCVGKEWVSTCSSRWSRYH